jgi:hypothetical protein
MNTGANYELRALDTENLTMIDRPFSALVRGLAAAGPVQAGLLSRAVQTATGVITLCFVAWLLTPMQQGYFFTFMGLLAAQQLLELGLPLVIMQVASHHSVGVTWDGRIARFFDAGNAHRVAGLFAWSVRWYCGVAIAFLCTVIPAGWFVLSGHTSPDTTQSWQGAWLLAGVVLGANLLFIPPLALLEGSGKISHVYLFRMWQEAIASLVLWLSLLGGSGLYSIGIYLAVRAAASAVYVGGYRDFFALLWQRRAEVLREFDWRREVWPFQWRISVSSGAGYLIFQVSTPIVFAVLGPLAAGQWGLTYLAVQNIAQFWLIWVSARAPELGKMAAEGRYAEMERIFFHAAFPSLVTSAAGLTAGYILLVAAFLYRLPYFDRFIEPLPAALLVGWALVNQTVSIMAVYLRAHREEPYLLPSLAGGILMPPSVYLLGKGFGIEGVAASYLVLACLIGLGWGGAIFWDKITACRALSSKGVAS